jgi:hypothetical protein
MRQQGAHQQEAGTPLSTDGQRVDVLGAKAATARVSRSTAAKVEAAKKRSAGAVARIAQGLSTANQELGKSSRPDKGADKNVEERTKEPEVGDLIYTVDRYSPAVSGSPKIIEYEVRQVDTHSYACADGTRLHKPDAFSLAGAKARRCRLIQDQIADLEADLKRLKALIKQEPIVVPAKEKSR